MVKIPDRPNGPLAGGRIDPHSVGNSSAIFRGIAQGADKVFQAALHMQETRDHDLLVEAQNAYTNAMTGWTTEAEQSRQGGSARGFTQDFTKQHEATAEDVLARMKQNGGSGNAEAAFQNWSASRQSVGLAGAAQFEHRQMQLHGQDMHNLRVQTIVESLGHNPAAFGDAFQQLEESYALAVGQGIYRPEEAKVRFNDAREKLKLTAFDNLYAANRGQAMKSMDALGLDLVQKAKAKKRYQADVQAEAAAARAARAESRELLRGREQDLVAAFTTGAKVNESQIPTEKEYVSAFGEKDGKERYQSLMQMEQLGNDLRDLQHMTPEEQAKTYANRGTEPGSKGYADNVKLQGIRQKAIELDQKMRAADPALYVLRADDSVRAAYEKMQQSTNPEDAQAYARALRAGYEARGMKAEDAAILPRQEVKLIGDAFLTQKPENAATIIIGQQAKWGNQWPEVYKQLVQDKDVKLPTAAYAIGAGMEPEAAVLLADAAQIPDFSKYAKETLGKEAFDELDKSLPSVFEPLGSSMVAQGGLRQASQLFQETRKLALQYMLRGIDADNAASKAYDEIGGKRYTFQEGYRVPAGLDANKIAAGTQAYINEHLKKDGWKIDYGQPWQTPQDLDELTREAIRQNATWVTAPDESGLVLYRGPFAVQRQDGTPVAVTWDQLLKSASDRKERIGISDSDYSEYGVN